MLELLTALSFIGYLVYLRYYADQRTDAQKEADRLREGIDLYNHGQMAEAKVYFDRELITHPKSGVAYLYRARIRRSQGDVTGAKADVELGKSYEGNVADLYLESGQIHFDEGDFQTAFLNFDKAVFHSFGQESQPYFWRGLARKHLSQEDLSQHDFKRAEEIAAQRDIVPAVAAHSPFFDKPFFLHTALAALGGVLVLLVAKQGYGIHVPYLAAVLSGVSLGWLQPRKGWLLALVQVAVLLMGYVLLMDQFIRKDLAAFSVFGSVGLILVGGLLGGVLKRNL